MTNDELLHKWVDGTISQEELAVFKQRPEYEELTLIYRLTNDIDAPQFDENKALSAILSTPKGVESTPKEAKVVSFRSYFKYAAAAAILFVGAWFLLNTNTNRSYATANAKTLEGMLPDGSAFAMNAGSLITFDEKDWANNRTLDLQGEAFFTVKKGSNFTVNTGFGAVKVLGTKFNVNARENELRVQCKEGKVGIYDPRGVELAVITTQEAVWVKDGELIERWAITEGQSDEWMRGISSFKNERLKTILEELERQYDVQINTEGIDANALLTTSFPHNDLEAALKLVLSPSGIRWEISNQTIRVFEE